MSHSRRQSRPPPKNPLPARFLRRAFGFFGLLSFPFILYLVSYILLTSVFKFTIYNTVGAAVFLHQSQKPVVWRVYFQ